MTAADRIIRWTTAGPVVGVAVVAAVASYEHAYALARAHGEAAVSSAPLWPRGRRSRSSDRMSSS